MTRATESITTTNGNRRFNKRPSNAIKSPEPSASASDWRCLLSYCLVCASDELLPNALSRNTRSQTASAKPEPQIISKGGEPISRPTTAKQTDTAKHIKGNPVAGYFRASNQAKPVMIAIAVPIHFPTSPYPAARHSIETDQADDKKSFSKEETYIPVAPYFSRCPRERVRAFRTNGNKGWLICQSMTGICSWAILFSRRRRSSRAARIARRLVESFVRVG